MCVFVSWDQREGRVWARGARTGFLALPNPSSYSSAPIPWKFSDFPNFSNSFVHLPLTSRFYSSAFSILQLFHLFPLHPCLFLFIALLTFTFLFFFFFFFMVAIPLVLWSMRSILLTPTPQTKDWTWALGSENAESLPGNFLTFPLSSSLSSPCSYSSSKLIQLMTCLVVQW